MNDTIASHNVSIDNHGLIIDKDFIFSILVSESYLQDFTFRIPPAGFYQEKGPGAM